MTIQTVALSNTFNQFRETTNLVIGEVNKLSNGAAVLVVDTITANTFTGVSSDLDISGNTGSDTITLGVETLSFVGTNNISTSVTSNTVVITLNASGVSAGTYGSASQVPTLVIDAQGRITSASNVNVAGVSAFNYHSGNANFQISTADGGSFTASIGQHLGTTANVTFQTVNASLTGVASIATVANTVTLTSDNSTNATRYLTFVDAATGNEDIRTDTGLTYNPSTGVLTTTEFSGSGASITNINANNISSGTLPGARGVTAGSASASFITYNGTTKTSGQFDGGSTAPTNTTRLNYDGNLYATNFFGNGSNLTGISSGLTVSDDTSTNATRYLTFTDQTSGTETTAFISSTKLYFNPSTGTLNATVFNSLSDETLKKNITKITNATDLISLLDGVEFEWAENCTKSSGLIAQWIEKVVPHLVDTGENGLKTVNYSGLIAYLIEAVKELNERVKKLEGE